MQRIFLLLAALVLIAIAFSCRGDKPTNDAHGDTPTEAYKRLFAAVKSRDLNAIKAEMTKKTLDLNRMGAQKAGKSEDQQLMQGMTTTTYADTLPEIRDERIKDNMGAVEVWDSKDSTWQDLPFMIEDSKWKFAMGDSFAGTYHSPGKGRDLIEKQAANALHPQQTPIVPNVNIPPAPSPNR